MGIIKQVTNEKWDERKVIPLYIIRKVHTNEKDAVLKTFHDLLERYEQMNYTFMKVMNCLKVRSLSGHLYKHFGVNT